MRALPEFRRIPSARRTVTTILSLLLLTSLMGAASVVQSDTASEAAIGHDTSAARTPTNPDQPTLPVSCRPAYGYMKPAPCRLVPRKVGAPLIILWGDSHAWMMTPAIRRAVAGKNVNVIALMQGACPIMDSDLSTAKKFAARNACDEFGQLALDYIDRARRLKPPVRVIVSMSWELYNNAIAEPDATDDRYPGYVNDYIRLNARKGLTGTPRAFKALSRMGVRTDIVAAEPMVYETAPECPSVGFFCDLPRVGVLKDGKENNARIYQLRNLLRVKGTIIRPATSLCSKTKCRGTIGGVPTYWDRLHIGQRASYQLAPHFAPVVKAILKEAADQRR